MTNILDTPWVGVSFDTCRWGGYIYVGPLGFEWTNTEIETWRGHTYHDWGSCCFVWKNQFVYHMGWSEETKAAHWFICHMDRFTAVEDWITPAKIKKSIGKVLNSWVRLFR